MTQDRHTRGSFWLVLLCAATQSCWGQLPATSGGQTPTQLSRAVVTLRGADDTRGVQGSGFLVSPDGKIATALHVVRDITTATVYLASGDTYDVVSVLAVDERRDLAVIKIAGYELPYMKLGDSDRVNLGERVFVLGSPHGLDGTITAGVLSSVRDNRAIPGTTVLQTDASVNAGNSGGPLVNAKGEAIGVVSFGLKSSSGLNFAVPINYVRGLVNSQQTPFTLPELKRKLRVDATPDLTNSAGNDPCGWGGAKWGMTEQEILNAVPQAHELSGNLDQRTYLSTPRRFVRVGIQNLDIGGTLFTVHFQTDPETKTLDRIIFHVLDGDGQLEADTRNIERLLRAKYGPPTTREELEDGLQTHLTWLFNTTVIRLNFGKGTAKHNPFMALSYAFVPPIVNLGKNPL